MPARILRGGWALDAPQRLFISRFIELVVKRERGEPVEPIDVEQPPPGAIIRPTLYDLQLWELELMQLDDRTVTCDLEGTDHVLRGVGFCRVADLKSVWVPLVDAGGAPYWDPSELVWVRSFLERLLADPSIPLVYHNISFDVPYLRRRMGWVVEGPLRDTMVEAHCCDPELKKGLQALATLWIGLPNWKKLVRQDDETAEGKS